MESRGVGGWFFAESGSLCPIDSAPLQLSRAFGELTPFSGDVCGCSQVFQGNATDKSASVHSEQPDVLCVLQKYSVVPTTQ